jgi:hypothetical protein
MRYEDAFKNLASFLGIKPEALEELIGAGWNSTAATQNLIVRGTDLGTPTFFFEDDEDESDEEDESDDAYPDVGILVESSSQVQVGTLGGVYSPAPEGFYLKPLLTLSSEDPLVKEKLVAAIEYATKVYKAELQVCMYCKESLPPYTMSEDGHCYGCGSSELGIVY